MKSGIIAIVLVMAMIIASVALADVPGSINYQGRLADQTGAPLRNVTNNAADGWIDLTFRIFNAAAGGTRVWDQTITNVEVVNGLFSVQLTGLTTNVFPANNQVSRWLEVEVITNGVVTNVLAPRKEIVSVAYAIRAGDADTVDGKHANQLGGITNETDPQVADNQINNYVPRWNSATTQLVGGTIVDNGSIGIGGTAGAGYRLDVNGQAIIRDHLTVHNADIWMDADQTIRSPWGRLNIQSGQGQALSLNPDGGNVGLGTPNPGHALHINNDRTLRLEGPSAANDNFGFSMGGYGFFGIDAPGVPNGRFVVRNNGNVGIGPLSANPIAGLDISRAGTWGSLAIRNTHAGSSTHFDMPDGKNYIRGTTIIADQGGNVGIGPLSASPLAGLDISRAGPWGSLAIRNTYAGYSTHFDMPDGKNYIRGTTIIADKGGNVGLGTANPGSRLDIGGAAGASLYATLAIKQSAPGAQKGIWLQANQNNNSLFMSHSGYGGFIGTDWTGTDGSPTPLTFIAYGKEINIGTVAVPSHLEASANIYYNGELIKRVSDTRMKVDQRQLDYGLTNVMALNPIRYNEAEWGINPETKELIIYPERISKTNEIGLAAQEVKQVIPEAVSVPEDENQMWGLDYTKLVPVLIKAIQEQQAQIEELKKGIEELKKEIQAIKSGI